MAKSYYLSMPEWMFIGTKPEAVIIEGERIIARNWREVFVTVLRHCLKDPVYHARLMNLRNMVLGRQRTILSDSPEGMTRPFEVCEGLYAEVQYGTQALVYNLKSRILESIEFNYSNIKVELSETRGGRLR